MVLSGVPQKKSPVTPPGIDPGTVRLVAQRLNHYPTPGPTRIIVFILIQCGPGSVVGIATAYGLDGPGIESRWGEIFRTRP